LKKQKRNELILHATTFIENHFRENHFRENRLTEYSMSLLYLIICFAFIACYSVNNNFNDKKNHGEPVAEGKPVEINAKADKWESIVFPRFYVIPEIVTPGEACTVVYIFSGVKLSETNVPLKANLYNSAGKKISGAVFFHFALDDEGHYAEAAVLAPPSTTDPGAALIKIEGADGLYAELALTIAAREFAAEIIPLNPSNTGLRTVPDPQKTAESERLWAILSTTGTEIWTTGPFITPVPPATRRSSFFGDRRVYRYSNGRSDTAVHAGIDYAVIRGTEVHASAAGRVILARPRIVTGNSVILEHLPGFYSIYYHLDSIHVAEGALVQAGEVIALSGNTGLSTGPHLHWEMRASTENTDPDALLVRPILDSAAILNRLFGGQ
jgi:murein DD-endopeptidase MepM/ murein hydrolase activator NlpD